MDAPQRLRGRRGMLDDLPELLSTLHYSGCRDGADEGLVRIDGRAPGCPRGGGRQARDVEFFSGHTL